MSREAGWSGLPLHVEAVGRGPPVILLHGYAASSFSFRHWVPGLARDHRVLAVDLKGFGSAPKPDDGRYDPRDLAEPVVRLIRRLDLRDVTLVGHSLGGGVALVVALDLADAGELGRVRGLVSVDGAAYPQRTPPFARLARWPRLTGAALKIVPTGRLVEYVLRTVVHEPDRVDREQVEGYARPLRSSEARRALLAAARQVVPRDFEALIARYPEIDVPTLLMWGRHDAVVPLDVGRRLARALPRARLRVLDACGHLPAEERPRESLRLLRAFLAEAARAGVGEARGGATPADGLPGGGSADPPPGAGTPDAPA